MLLSGKFSINFVGYLRVYSNGRALAFSNNLSWQSFFLENINNNSSKSFKKATHLANCKENSLVYIWPDVKDDKTLSALRSYNIWNGMSLYRHTDEYIDSWSFAGELQDENLFILYIKHIDIFEKFINYAEKNSSDLLKVEDSRLFQFSTGDVTVRTSDSDYSEAYINNFKRNSPLFKNVLPQGESNIYLTRRENDLLDCLALGMTSKDIAQELGISYRTVECYLQSLKSKLGCNRKSEVIRKAKNII